MTSILIRLAAPGPALLAVITALGPSSARAASLADRLPGDATAVAGVDFASLRKSAVFDLDGWTGLAPAGPTDDVRHLLQLAGIDVRRDVDEIAIAAFSGRTAAGVPPKSSDFALLVSGRFDSARVITAALAGGGREVTGGPKGSATTIRFAGRDGEPPLLLTLLGPGILAVGSEEGTRRVQEGGRRNETMAAARSRIPTSASFWLLADAKDAGGTGAAAVPGASAVTTIALWGLATDVLDLNAVAETADAASAMQLAAVLQLGAGALRAAGAAPAAAPSGGSGAATPPPPPAAPGVGSLLDTLRLAADGPRIVASLRLTKAQIDALAAD